MTRLDPHPADDADAIEAAETTAAAGSDAAAADSPLARLRRAYVQRRREAELFLPVPGWDGMLIARITVPDHEFSRKIRGTPGTIDWMADFVAETVAGLFSPDGVGDEGSSRLTPLEAGSGPLRFDYRYGEALGLPDVRSARDAVQSVFTVGGEDSNTVVNVVALADFANKIEQWLADTSLDVAEALVPGR